MKKLWAKVENDVVTVFPYTSANLITDYPDRAFRKGAREDSYFLEAGCVEVVPSTKPFFNRITQDCVQVMPVFIDSVLTQQWSVVDVAAHVAEERFNALKSEIVAQVQQRLDDFAATRNYNSMLSACTYATSSVPSFAAEGQYCVEARDATWTMMYTILDEVVNEQRAMPTCYEDIEHELPELAWPE